MTPSLRFVALLVVCVFQSTAAHAVVAAVPPRAAAPRVDAHIRGPVPADLRVVALLPFADPPGSASSASSASSGRLVADAVRRALESRGIRVVEALPPNDSTGLPLPPASVSGPDLSRIGRQAGADAAADGRLMEFHVEGRERPAVVLRRPGLYVGVPAEARVETRVVLSLRVIDTATGRLAFSATGRHGPVRNSDPEAVLQMAVDAVVEHWLGVSSH